MHAPEAIPPARLVPFDSDGDGVSDSADNCPSLPNKDQTDTDRDGSGDACDGGRLDPARTQDKAEGIANDRDFDGIADPADNCPDVPNRNQADLDGDNLGDACDLDLEDDGVPNDLDNCKWVVNPRQEDGDLDGAGDACEDAVPGNVDDRPVGPAVSKEVVEPTPSSFWVVPVLAAILAALYQVCRWLLGPAIVVLFSRIARSSLLEHPTREWIVQRVAAEPGIHYRQLAREAGSGRGAMAHHLRVLCLAGILRKERVGNSVQYYLPGKLPEGGMAQLKPLLRSRLAKAVAAEVLARPGAELRSIAEACIAGYGAVSYHLHRLHRAGAIEIREEDGLLRAYAVDPRLGQLMGSTS